MSEHRYVMLVFRVEPTPDFDERDDTEDQIHDLVVATEFPHTWVYVAGGHILGNDGLFSGYLREAGE